jgi:hypothetical protein
MIHRRGHKDRSEVLEHHEFPAHFAVKRHNRFVEMQKEKNGHEAFFNP